MEKESMVDQLTNKRQSEHNTLTVLDLILTFLRYKKKIIITSGVICIISIVLYFFVFDLIYFSSATIRSSNKSSGLLGSLETSLPDLGDLSDIGISGKSTKEIAGYVEILNSRRCIEPLIVKFDLMNRDNIRYMEDAIKEFSKEKMVLDENKVAGTLSIGVYDKNPELAKEMVEYLLDQLNKINVEMNVLNARNNREFIENRYNLAREDLSKAEDSLKSFQLIYGISPDLQVKAAAQTEFSIEGELKAEEVKLDVLKKILSSDQIEVKTQEAKINSMKDQITKMRTSTNINDLLSLGNAPQTVLSFLRLEREVEIQSKIVSFLLPVYEQAKIEEKKETPTILILDKPYVAEKKTKPKRLTMVLVWSFIGFVGSFTFFFSKERFYILKHTLNELKIKNS